MDGPNGNGLRIRLQSRRTIASTSPGTPKNAMPNQTPSSAVLPPTHPSTSPTSAESRTSP